MPQVGKRHYPYTPEGMRKAQEAARRLGKRVRITRVARTDKKRVTS